MLNLIISEIGFHHQLLIFFSSYIPVSNATFPYQSLSSYYIKLMKKCGVSIAGLSNKTKQKIEIMTSQSFLFALFLKHGICWRYQLGLLLHTHHV